MAIVTQTNTRGFRRTLDGVVYRNLGGRTIASRLPHFPQSMFATAEARQRQSLFKLTSMVAARWGATLRLSYDRSDCGTSRNNWLKNNNAALRAALQPLAVQMAAGTVVTVAQAVAAVETYATVHPDIITIGKLKGYTPCYLTGAFPATITMHSLSSTASVVIVVSPDGVSRTISRPSAGSTTVSTMVTITGRSANSAQGTVSGSATVNTGATVTLVATPAQGYTFASWQDGNTSATRTVTATESATYTASFTATSGDGGSGGGDDSLGG